MIKRRTIEVVVGVGGLVFLFGFLAVVILSLFLRSAEALAFLVGDGSPTRTSWWGLGVEVCPG